MTAFDTLRRHARTARALTGLAPAVPSALAFGVDGLVRRRARRAPDAPCLRTPDRTLSNGRVDAAADHRAAFWRARGVGPGDTVALLMDNRVEGLLHQLALSRLGAAAALVNTHLRGAGLAHVLTAARAQAVVVDGPHVAALATLEGPPAAYAPRGVWLDGDPEAAPPGHPLPDLAAALNDVPFRRVRSRLHGPDSVFCYLFTSGTTGLPKAAPIRHQRHLAVGAALQSLALWLGPDDVVFTPLPLYHASAQLVALGTALAADACFAFAPRFSASHYWADAVAVGATVGVYVGELCRYLLAAAPAPAEHAHRVHTFVGNGLRADVWPAFQRRFGVERIVEFYGATEGNALLINRDGKVGSCGRPLLVGPFDGLELVRYDVDRDAHPRDAEGHLIRCADGEVGELVSRIGALPTERFDGYLDPAATDRKVLRDCFRRGDRYFRTGDLLRRDAEGDFFFVDRIGDTFRWKGENVSTQEVAEALAGAAGLENVTVYGVEVPRCEGRAGMAAVTLAEGARFDGEVVYRRAAETLPGYARPAFVRVCAALDQTSTMKFKKTRLAREAYAPGADALYVRDDAAGRYAPLDDARRAELEAGRLRL